jgi:hypothetical protein
VATATVDQEQLERLKDRLLNDAPFFAEKCLKIVNKGRKLVPLIPKAAQLRLDATMEAQTQAGKPMRVIILKARQIGFSTWVQARIMQSVLQRPYRHALVLAHNKDTGGELFEIGRRMYLNMPTDPLLGLYPDIAGRRRARMLHFGTKQDDGSLIPDSTLKVDTAQEFEAGRGQTFSEAHCSELAFYPDAQRKLLGVLQAVPDEEGTLVVLESTANGFNYFKTLWDASERGDNEFVGFFSPWFEEPSYSRAFLTEADRIDFEASLDEYERGLLEESPYPQARAEPLTLEQLHWRRHTLANPPFLGDLMRFQQEMPATPMEAFIASGRQRFDAGLVQKVIRATEETDPKVPTEENPGPILGVLKETGTVQKKGRHGYSSVPTGAKWVPREEAGFGSRHAYWRVWEQPIKAEGSRPAGQYVIALDPASGEETEEGESAYHALQVINHKTREQVAEYRSRIDADLVGIQLYLALLHWNNATMAVEITGGHGRFIAKRIYHDFKYPRHLTYFRKQREHQNETESDLIGWDTQTASKAEIEDLFAKMLREGTHGIRSRLLANELTTFIKDERGRTGPEKNAFADLLMAYMIAQQVAQEMRPRPERKIGQVPNMLSKKTRQRWLVSR